MSHQQHKDVRTSQRWVVTVTRTIVQSIDVVVEDVNPTDARRALANGISEGCALYDRSVSDMVSQRLDMADADECDVELFEPRQYSSCFDPDVVVTRVDGRAVSVHVF